METSSWPLQNERRVHHEIRAIFVQACALLAPFFAETKETPSMSRFGMAHMLNDHFPTLSSAEAYIAVSAIERLQQDKRLHRLLEQ